MKYCLLLWPHANTRYQEAIRPLGQRELTLVLGERDLSDSPVFEDMCGASFLRFESALAPEDVAGRLRDLAHLLLLFSAQEDGSLLPLCGPREPRLGGDLSGILKYKGKTNEVFTRFLLNLALYSSAFSGQKQQNLQFFDPMCGRGTALFEALNRGWDAVGSDIDQGDIHEAGVFFKRYLEYHRIKHQSKEQSMTLPGKKAVRRLQIRFSTGPEGLKGDAGQSLSLMAADICNAVGAFPKKSFHLMAMDLPYGVQHSSGGGRQESLEALLVRALPVLKERLLPGGAVALSFNVHGLKRDRARQLLNAAGLTPMVGGPYDGLEHWVEQAVTRDVAVAVRKDQ